MSVPIEHTLPPFPGQDTVCIDYDNSIVAWDALDAYHEKLLPGALEAAQEFKRMGKRIVIFTSRLDPVWLIQSGNDAEVQYRHVSETLRRFGFPYDEITGSKRVAGRYFDDRGITLTSWDRAMASYRSGISIDDLAWIAGILEGEGSIVFRGVNKVIVQVSMSDKDVIDRLHSLFGFGSRWQEQRPGYLPLYGWRVHSGIMSKHVIESILPWLGERRKNKAIEALQRIQRNVRYA